jgi:hypothetical protein
MKTIGYLEPSYIIRRVWYFLGASKHTLINVYNLAFIVFRFAKNSESNGLFTGITQAQIGK